MTLQSLAIGMLQFATSVCIKSYFSGYRLHRPHLSCLSKAQGAGAKAGVEAEEGAECMAVTHPKQTCPLGASATHTTAMLPQALLQPPAPCSSRRGRSQLMLLLAKSIAVDSKTKATAGCEMLLHAVAVGISSLLGKAGRLRRSSMEALLPRCTSYGAGGLGTSLYQ